MNVPDFVRDSAKDVRGCLIEKLLSYVLPVGWPDRRRALAAFLLFGVFMASYYVFKSARESLFGHYQDAKDLPMAYIGSTVIAGLAMVVYGFVFRRIGGRRLMQVTVGALIGSAVLFWPFWLRWSDVKPPLWFLYVFFFWVTLYGVMAATLFWSVSNDCFDTVIGKKIYGFVGAGGIFGAFVGSKGTELLVVHGGVLTEGLLPFGAGMLLAAIPLMRWLFRVSPSIGWTPEKKAKAKDGLILLLTNRYAGAIALLVFFMTFAGTLFDIQYKDIVYTSILDKETKTAFFGNLYAWISAFGFAIQITVTGPVLRKWGPIAGLVVLPCIGLIGAFVLFFNPTLFAVQLVWTLAGSTLYSINQSSKEMLYIPTGDDVKYGAKGFIDVFVYRLGDGAGSIVVLLFTRVLSLALAAVLPVVVLLLPVWGLLLSYLRKAYKRRLAGDS